ncbi:hypothetical protein EIJ81_12150 [Aliivibrio salmonicida]|uniref:Uncharacterized protein n=1 Tax=Aliivibrio salmonicida (strain LFI1238) TaxID=316275 RepID=B6EI25_ALISL|nr:hypothetical protein [Aliivibrio salmonicida]AZL85249.1 hypothetical protein EIJ81_12150 [Aliivibrio salmonicida]CAQ79762.1 hypothetical protein VSAL_I2077 [Aliivibrio salmonicida LFI1238]
MKYKVEISKDEKVLFEVLIDDINRNILEENLTILLDQFPNENRFKRHVFYSDTENRILKSTERSMEVIAIQPIFKDVGYR